MTARATLPAAIGLALATPVATWWLLDPSKGMHAIGIGSVVLLAITAGTLIVATANRRFDRRWWSVLAPVPAENRPAGSDGYEPVGGDRA